MTFAHQTYSQAAGARTMFCSDCGKPVHGKFCAHCGAKLIIPLSNFDAETNGPMAVDIEPDWDHTVQYETILKFPGVRDTIERHARQAPQRISGEQFLALADKVIPSVVPLEKLAPLVQSLYGKLGIKTSKERAGRVAAPVGRVIVRALCSLARNGQTLQGVTQTTDGCLFEATLPSDLFALAGNLTVSVRRQGTTCEVRGATNIPGQYFDWGKSTRCLEKLFRDLERDAA